MKLQLPILFFVSLFTCVGVFYWSQLNITISYGETARQHRRHHGFSTLDYGRSEDRLNAAEQEPAQVGVNAHRHRRRRRRRGTHNHTRSSSELEPAQVQKLEQLRQQSQQMQREAKAAEDAAAAAASSGGSSGGRTGSSGGGGGGGGTEVGGACTRTRRPYHVVMTAASGLYQEWQSRIAYYHYRKQKALHPCSDLGGFTRLFNNVNARPDALVDEMPTLLVSQLGHGSCAECDRGFIVMNRPWGVVQLVESEHFRSKIAEEYIFVIETDHMIMSPPENTAKPDRPVGFGFYYMLGTDPKLRPVVQKFLAPGIEPETVDAVGPSPIIIHKPLLARVAKPWWEMSQRMQHDRDAQVIFGWVLEMWGYNLAVRNLGIRHEVSKDIQVEPQGEGTDDMDKKSIYHYTFGLTPKPPYVGARTWRLDKRQYYGGYPSDHLAMPPACTARSGFIIASMWNEAAQNIPGWKTRHPAVHDDGPTDDLRTRLLGETKVESATGLGSLLRGTGPWRWGKIERLFLFSRGVAYVPGAAPPQKGPVGSWAVAASGAEGGGKEVVKLTLCGQSYILRFADESSPWAAGFTATHEGSGTTSRGELGDRRQHTPSLLDGTDAAQLRPSAAAVAAPDGALTGAPLVSEIAGSGPWFWAGSGPLGFMRGGVLITPWGEGVWGLKRGGQEEAAPADTVFADFANSQHNVRMHNAPCVRMSSRRKADGDVVGIDFAGAGITPTCGAAP
jgi:hypothetical protein